MLNRSTPPPVHKMGHLVLPPQHIETLSNGLTLHSLSGGSQDVNQLSLVWPGGISEAPSPEVARLLAMTLREGTSKLSGAEISEAIDFNGAMVRSSSDSHFTVLNISVLNSKTANLLPLISDIISDASFPDQAFETYRDIELREFLLSRSKVSVLCAEDLAKLIKGQNHPQSRVMTTSDINDVTVEQVRDYYKRVFTADGCHAFLSGNLTPDILAEVHKMLESMPVRGKAVQLSVLPYEAEAPQCTRREEPGFVQAAVQMAIPAPGRENPDYVPLRVTVTALGGFFGSRLMKNIREDKGYTYGIAAYLLGAHEGSYILIQAQTDRKYVDALIEEVRKELMRMLTAPLTPDELMRLKQYMSTSLMETLDSPFSVMDFYRTMQCLNISDSYFDDQVRTVRDITPSAIMDMAGKYLDPSQLRISVVQ